MWRNRVRFQLFPTHADINMALQLMREVGEQMQHEPPHQEAILEPIEVVGVDALADRGVRVKARIKTQPGKQWSVGREFLKRIKLAFDANAVEIPTATLKLVQPDQLIQLADRASHAAE